ncbi:MAG: tryptophan--tRNA ligase [Alphaproteobacteria bacterium]|jgi:tryptophanyl-tRNA synthetase|nr:tryptophan--tRNA ligase [Alphaproteobacteria bacterium]
MSDNKKILLSGLKPTGTPHIGNYMGMIRPAIEMSNSGKFDESYLFIADYHGINTMKDPKLLKSLTREVCAVWLALGLDPEKTVLYKQSDISEIFELNTIISAFTSKGLMNRAHAYKDAVQKNKDAGKSELDDGVNMGLYNYPILMAADIMIMGSNTVPVGKDQLQHLEMQRDIAGSFNANYGREVLVKADGITVEGGVMFTGTDGRKMSKSYNNVIGIFDSEKSIKKAVMSIKTDSKLPEDPKNPDDIVIFDFYKHFAKPEDVQKMKEGFENGGLGYGDAKKMLLQAILDYFAPYREKYEYYMSNPSELDKILEEGALKAKRKAQKVLGKVKKAVGVA